MCMSVTKMVGGGGHKVYREKRRRKRKGKCKEVTNLMGVKNEKINSKGLK